jgi:hypothetical protein
MSSISKESPSTNAAQNNKVTALENAILIIFPGKASRRISAHGHLIWTATFGVPT